MGTENINMMLYWLKLLHKATWWFRSVINDPEAATMKKKYVDYSTDIVIKCYAKRVVRIVIKCNAQRVVHIVIK